MPLDDQQVMQLVAAGRLELFDQLVQRHRSTMLRAAVSKLHEPADAEDAVQEAFLAAFRGRHTFDVRYSFRGWLWTILLNVCRRQPRRSTSHVSLQDMPAAAEPATFETPLSTLLSNERSRLLQQMLDQLPEVQADALRLRFFGELKFEEIAQAMTCSLNAAKDRVRKGLERLAVMARRNVSFCQAGEPS